MSGSSVPYLSRFPANLLPFASLVEKLEIELKGSKEEFLTHIEEIQASDQVRYNQLISQSEKVESHLKQEIESLQMELQYYLQQVSRPEF